MFERRAVRRRRVCLGGSLAIGRSGPVEEVRLRNLSARGAEIVAATGQVSARTVELKLAREEQSRPARVVWRRMNRFGLRFTDGGAGAANGEAGEICEELAQFLNAHSPKR